MLKAINLSQLSQGFLESLFNNVCNITENGFYDVSNTIITDDSKQKLRPLFKKFWNLLLQARKIVSWWCCSIPEVDINEILYVCDEARGLVNDPKVENILWSINILGDNLQVIHEINEDNNPTKAEILDAKEIAMQILQKGLDTIPALKCNLKHFLEDLKK